MTWSDFQRASTITESMRQGQKAGEHGECLKRPIERTKGRGKDRGRIQWHHKAASR